MSLSAVFKYMAKQAVDCRNMVSVKVWHTHSPTPLSGYSKITVNVYFNVLYEHFIIGRKIRIIRVFYYWT